MGESATENFPLDGKDGDTVDLSAQGRRPHVEMQVRNAVLAELRLLAQAAPLKPQEVSPMTPDLSILIVDDDPGSLHLLQRILRDAGLTVRTAQSPTAALRQLEEYPPDLLLTDLRMPEMSGLDLLRAARGRRPDLCCLVVTAFATDEATAEIFHAGAQDLFHKPINATEVRARIQHAAEVVLLRREVETLRVASAAVSRTQPSQEPPPRAREVSDLPALPGSAGPVAVGGREELFHRLERPGSLFRQGVISAADFEEKKRALLARI